jgi:hypothetical protein
MQEITCPECDWHYEEPIAEVTIPSAMMEAFSDPVGLANTLRTQRVERIAAAVIAHYREAHPHLCFVQ